MYFFLNDLIVFLCSSRRILACPGQKFKYDNCAVWGRSQNKRNLINKRKKPDGEVGHPDGDTEGYSKRGEKKRGGTWTRVFGFIFGIRFGYGFRLPESLLRPHLWPSGPGPGPGRGPGPGPACWLPYRCVSIGCVFPTPAHETHMQRGLVWSLKFGSPGVWSPKSLLHSPALFVPRPSVNFRAHNRWRPHSNLNWGIYCILCLFRAIATSRRIRISNQKAFDAHYVPQGCQPGPRYSCARNRWGLSRFGGTFKRELAVLCRLENQLKFKAGLWGVWVIYHSYALLFVDLIQVSNI